MHVLIISDEGIIVDSYYERLLACLYRENIKFNKSDIVLCKEYRDFDVTKDNRFDIAIIDDGLNKCGKHIAYKVMRQIRCDNIIIIANDQYLLVGNNTMIYKPRGFSNIKDFIIGVLNG